MPQGKRGIAQEPAPPFPLPPALWDFQEHLHLSMWHKGKQLAGYSSGFLVHGANDTGVLDMATWSPAAPGTHPLHPAAAHFYQPCSGRGSRDNRTQKMGGREETNQERQGGEREKRHTHTKKIWKRKGKSGGLEAGASAPLWSKRFQINASHHNFQAAEPQSSTPPHSGHASPSQPPSWQPTGPPAKPLPSLPFLPTATSQKI